MKERIKIDGAWYVLESAVKAEEKFDPIFIRGITHEDDSYRFEFEVLEKDGKFSMPSIDFTDKTRDPRVEEFWDNRDWMIGISKNDKDALDEISNISDYGIYIVKRMIATALDKGYL